MHKPKRSVENEREAQPARSPVGDAPPAWEAVEAGRYMPRRIRGSFRGRELG
jgi:hypothetical protein